MRSIAIGAFLRADHAVFQRFTASRRTPYDDCARVSGNELYVYADDGDDIVEAVGDYIYLDGGWGDDTLAASGGYNYVVGQGGVDTCFNGGEGGCTCEIKDCGDEDEPSAAAAP